MFVGFFAFSRCLWETKKVYAQYDKTLLMSRRVLWSWKRDLNTRPAHYEWAALPTELFQHILNFSVSLFDPPPCRFINNPRPAHYEWAALPTEPYQHIRPKYYTPKPHICQHQFKIFFKALQNPYQIVISYVACEYNVWNKYVFFPHRYFAQ